MVVNPKLKIKDKQAQKIEREVTSLVNELAPKLEPAQRDTLLDLIGEQKAVWRMGTAVYFPEELQADFEKLCDLLRKLEADPNTRKLIVVGRDATSEDKMGLFIGEMFLDGVTEVSATSPFTEEKKKEIIEKVSGKMVKQLDLLSSQLPKTTPAKKALTSQEEAFRKWRRAEFERLYKVSYQGLQDRYEEHKKDYDAAASKDMAGATKRLLALKGVVDIDKSIYAKLRAPKFIRSFRQWAKKEYSAGTSEYKKVCKSYNLLLKGIRTNRNKNLRTLAKARKELATLAKKSAAKKKFATLKKLTRKEKAIMLQLQTVIEQTKEIYKSQYKVGNDYLEKFLADYAKLQKMLAGKKISEPAKNYAEVAIRGANTAFWKKYAKNRLAPPVKAEKEEEWIREKIIPGKIVMPSDPAMKWVKAQYKRKTRISYDKNTETYTDLKKAYESAESLASQLRLVQQIADNTQASYKALAAMEKTFKKKFPEDAKAFDALLARVQSAAEATLNASKPTMDNLYAWAGSSPSAEAYLDSNRAAIEKMLETVYGAELAKVLEYVDAAIRSELTGTKNPRPRPRIVLGKAEEFRAVREGVSVLYAAKGLQKPVFKKTKALRKSLRGKYLLVDISSPELFVRPNKKEILPLADKDGNVFIKYKGRKIWLDKGQKELIESALRGGSVCYTEIDKYGKKARQVDAAGADLLVQYLRGKGWTNIETTKWIGGRARAGVRTLEVSQEYWDRPVAQRIIKEVKPVAAVEKKLKRREDDELFKSGKFEIEEPKSKRFGRILDRPAERSKFEVARQKEGLEYLVNNPGTDGTVFFEHVGVARNAAAMLRAELLGRNDLRAVSMQVIKNNYWGNIEGAYLTVGELPENAFAQRSNTPLMVPAAYDKKAILANASDRAALQDFLNGKSKEGEVTFRAGVNGKEALESYLARIGYPLDKVTYSQLIKPEVEALPKMESMLLGDEIWESTLASVPMPAAPVEERESVAVRGIRGGGELQRKREREYYGSDQYRLGLRTSYATSEAWLKNRLEKKALAEGKKAEYDVSHGLQNPSDVYVTHSQDYNRMSEDQRAYTVLAAAGQGFSHMVLGKDKGRLYWQNNIARNHLTVPHMVETAEGARFSEDVQAEVLKHMLYMHTGPGKMLKKDKTYYPERAAQMLAVLSKYKTIDEFADAINNNYTATAIYDSALQLTKEALDLDLSYMMMSPAEQAKKWDATFDLMWRGVAVVVMAETGQTPSSNPEQRQLDKCSAAFVDYLAGRGENNFFTVGGHRYKTLEAIVVRYDGKNVLAVPDIDEHGNINPKWTHIVGKRVRKTAPEGYVYWKNELSDKDKMFKVRTKRAWSDSIGPAGLTFRHVWGTNPPELNIGEKPPKLETIPIPLIKMFFPEYYAPRGYVAVANDLYWEQVGMSFTKDPTNPEQTPKQLAESVVSRLPNGVLMLTTLSGEMVVDDSKFFIHPPRTMFSPNGRELPVVEDYPTFRTYAYSSAYVDFSNAKMDVPVYAFRKAGKKMDSLKFIPENARRYAGMSDKKLEKEGIFKIRIGTFNRRSGTIEYRKYKAKDGRKVEKVDMEEYFGKHTQGSWAANTKDLRKMTDEDKEAMGVITEPDRHYYVVESSHTAVPPKTSMEIGSHEEIGVTGSTKEDGMVFVSGNVPLISGEWNKGKKKKR